MFDTQRHLRARQTQRDRASIKNDAAYASPGNHNNDPVEVLKRKLARVTEQEWNDFRWSGLPSRLR